MYTCIVLIYMVISYNLVKHSCLQILFSCKVNVFVDAHNVTLVSLVMAYCRKQVAQVSLQSRMFPNGTTSSSVSPLSLSLSNLFLLSPLSACSPQVFLTLSPLSLANGPKISQIFPKVPKLSQVITNGPEWSKVIQKGFKLSLI